VAKVAEGPWTKLAAIATIIGVAIAALAYLGVQLIHSQPAAKPSATPAIVHEEKLVSLLKPGDDYAKMAQIIGAVPDAYEQLKSGHTLYQFDRPWEYIDLVVYQGSVLSVGIIAKNPAFKPILHEGSISLVPNGAPIVRQASGLLVFGASGECGGSGGGNYYQGYSVPHARGFGSFLLGWEIPGLLMPDAICGLLFNQCSKATPDNFVLSMRLFNCIINHKDGQQALATFSPSVVVLVRPGIPLLPDMWDIEPLAS
jgi:hypothetical protein